MLRSHNLGELNLSDINKGVTLCGWVHKTRDLGGMTFVDLRDRYGITQLAFNIETNEELCKNARSLGREYVIQISGKVIERSSKNPNIPTGEIEIDVTELKILNKSKTPPFGPLNASLILKPLPSSRFFFTLNAGSAGNFLASLPGNLNFPSGPLQEIKKIGKINKILKIFKKYLNLVFVTFFIPFLVSLMLIYYY